MLDCEILITLLWELEFVDIAIKKFEDFHDLLRDYSHITKYKNAIKRKNSIQI
jgi:hypothetical protein